jgi:branched-chain amino acid transport system permease protein
MSAGRLRVKVVQDRGLFRGSAAGAVGGALLAVAAVLTLVAFVALLFGESEHDIVILFGINAVLVIGLQMFVGNTGIMSFGHIAFMGIGAYSVGIVSVPVIQKGLFLKDLPHFLAKLELSAIPSLALAGVVAGVCGLGFGLLVVRLPEATATIVTFGVLVVVHSVLRNASALTRGDQTFIGVPQRADYVLVFGVLAVMVALSACFKWSRFGLRARATAADPVAAEASGIRVSTARLWPFALSAFITGVGGGLWAYQVTAFSPNSFYISQSIGVIAMMILGGLRSITGALAGATVMSIWLELVRHVESGLSIGSLHIAPIRDLSQLTLGIALILLLRWRPEGLVGAHELQVDRARAPGRDELAGAPAGSAEPRRADAGV